MDKNQLIAYFITLSVSFFAGLYVGWEGWGKALRKNAKDAARWRWWRRFHKALCSQNVANYAGLDLTKIYVTTPEQLDSVTDAAMSAHER